MPNSSGVYPNSVAGFNASIANQSAPRPDAFGSYGTDPITGASYRDQASAQSALAQYANPNSLPSQYARSMQPTMLPTGGGQGGGGGGRMGPREPRKKIMRVGPRTASEFTAEKGGLTPMRPSTLDAAYAQGDLTNPNAPPAPRPNAAPNIPPPINDSFAGGAGMGAGAAVGNMMTPALLGVGKVTAQNIAQGEGKVPVYYDGGIDNMGTVPKAGTMPLSEIGEYNPQEYAEDSVSYALDALPGGSKAPTMLAKGGPMKIGQKPYLVGEEGPELIMPRQNGDGYVLPADVTQQLLPMMTKRPTPRQQGGIMEMNTPNARFAGGATPYGPTFAMQQREDQINSAEFTEQERELAQQPDQRMIVDNGYQVDLPALRAGGRQSIPLQPDVVTGPWASRAMPADTTGLQPYLQNQVSRLSMTGAKPISKYPGQTFNDTSAKSFLEYGNAMPGDTVEQLEARTRQYQQGLRDPYAGSAGSGLTFEEMQQRMALRGMMYGDDYRDRQARDRTQLDLAARNARAPLGTPTMLPGQGSEARIQANLARQMERLSRTPQGAMFFAKQQQQMAEGSQKVRDRQAMIQPVPLGTTGQFIIPLTGQVINPETGSTRQMTPEEAQAMGLVPMSVEGQTVRYGRPTDDQGDYQVTQMDGPMVSDPMFPERMIPGPRQTVRVNKKTGEYTPLKPAGSKAETGKAGTDGGQDFKTYYDSIPKGGTYTHPDGSQRVKK
jgi:hypothetical protein